MGVVTGSFPPETVDELVEACGVRERRRRDLPADVMVYFTIGLWLWRDLGYVEVFKQMTDSLRLAGWRSGEATAEVPNSASITKARARIGWEVMEALFDSAAGPVGEVGDGLSRWAGLRVLALDGCCLEVPDTEANAAEFGRPEGAAFPQARCVALAEVGTRAVVSAAFEGCSVSEKALTETILDRLGAGDVVVWDRGFTGYDLASQVLATGAHVVMRAGSQFPLPVLESLPDGSWISEMRKRGRAPIRVRVVEYSVAATDPVTGQTVVGETVTLATSLLDPERYPIEDLPGVYRSRWRIEQVFDEVKTDLRGGTEAVFRSRSPEGVRAEFWGLMCLYQGIADVIGHVALTEAVPPDQVSFAAARSFVRRTVAWAGADFSPSGPDLDARPGSQGARPQADRTPTRKDRATQATPAQPPIRRPEGR